MDYFIDQIRDEFKKLEWDQVYSFIEFILTEVRGDQRRIHLTSEINRIFFEEGVQYKVVNGQVNQLMSNEEVEEISSAQESSFHITKAIELFNKRPNPDYANSIKEAISAVESIVKEKTESPNATLGGVVGKLGLHKELTIGLTSLYKWTSDEGGIRHGLKEGDKSPDEKEARLMLIICAGMVNYLSTLDPIKLESNNV